MPNSGQPPNQKFEAQDELDYLFANASPNPNREGCPSRDELVRVSQLETPMGDAAYAHIVRCSPCFREMRALQQAGATTRRTRMWAVATAAVVALSVAGAWWTVRSTTGDAVVATTIDLRPFAVMRGDSQLQPAAPVALQRGRLDVTFVLPLGADVGSYKVQLRDESLSIRASTAGEATLMDSVTTLRVPLDTIALPAGAYHLEVRHASGAWRRIPVALP